MTIRDVHQCGCPYCQEECVNQYKEQHQLMNLLLSVLDGQQRRIYAAIEVKRLGSRSVKLVSQITGIDHTSIYRGLRELKELSLTGAISRVAKPSGRPEGRPPIETRYPNIRDVLEQMIDYETAGNPMKEQKWIRSSVTQLRNQLKEQNINVGRSTVWKLLIDMGYSMRVNIKKRK